MINTHFSVSSEELGDISLKEGDVVVRFWCVMRACIGVQRKDSVNVFVLFIIHTCIHNVGRNST